MSLFACSFYSRHRGNSKVARRIVINQHDIFHQFHSGTEKGFTQYKDIVREEYR